MCSHILKEIWRSKMSSTAERLEFLRKAVRFFFQNETFNDLVLVLRGVLLLRLIGGEERGEGARRSC